MTTMTMIFVERRAVHQVVSLEAVLASTAESVVAQK